MTLMKERNAGEEGSITLRRGTGLGQAVQSLTYRPTHCAACLIASKVKKSLGLIWNLVCRYSRRSLYDYEWEERWWVSLFSSVRKGEFDWLTDWPDDWGQGVLERHTDQKHSPSIMTVKIDPFSDLSSVNIDRRALPWGGLLVSFNGIS